ncbi:MAK10-like protein [Tanacetum coccineum]
MASQDTRLSKFEADFKQQQSEMTNKIDTILRAITDQIAGTLPSDTVKNPKRRIVKDVEVHIGKLKLLNDFYVIDMKKDPETPLLVGRGFLTTANAVIDCRMAKIAVKERITRSVFGVKRVDLGEEEAPYWTMLRKGNRINHALARTE